MNEESAETQDRRKSKLSDWTSGITLERNDSHKKNLRKNLDQLLLESVEVFNHIDELAQNEPKKLLPHETPKVMTTFDKTKTEDDEYSPWGSKHCRKQPDNSPDSIPVTPLIPAEYSQKGKSQEGFKRKSRLKNCKSADSLLNTIIDEDSVDSIGDAADITILNEDSPLCPAKSVLENTEIFKQKSHHRNENPENGSHTTKAKYSKNYTFGQRFGVLKNPPHAKYQSDMALNKQPFYTFESYPKYLGYYFREIYRSTIKDLYEQRRIKDMAYYLGNDEVSDEDTVLPDLTDKQVDDNKTHVTQSMQGLYYMNSVRQGDDYKKLKKMLPPTNKTKLAIFDMDETLIH